MHVCAMGAAIARSRPVVIDLTVDDDDSGSIRAGPSDRIIIDLTVDSEDET